MALQTKMRRALRLVSEAIHDYVKVNGWDLNSYQLFYRADEVWNHLHIIFVAPEFKDLDYYSGYLGVMKHLKERLQNEPGLFESVGLVVRDPKRFEETGIGGVGSGFEDVASEFQDYWTLHRTSEH